MKVKEVMTEQPAAVWITDSLASAAISMWENDCGILPILKDDRKVVGLITDRDICMATAIRNRPESTISVEEVMSGTVYSVAPSDDIHKALEVMREHKLRRLPVLDKAGELKGIVSMNDIVLRAEESERQEAAADISRCGEDLQGDLRTSSADGQSGRAMEAQIIIGRLGPVSSLFTRASFRYQIEWKVN
jgi:CBS domain-containing protein